MANTSEADVELRLAIRIRNNSARWEQLRTALFRFVQPARLGQTRLSFRQWHLFQSSVAAYHRRFHARTTATLLRHEHVARSVDWKADDRDSTACVHCRQPALSANAHC